MKINKLNFFLGLIIFYLLTFFAPNKPIYFSAFFASTLFFYLSTKDLRISLVFSLILSLFSEVGLGGSLFLMEPHQLNLGSGWWLSPMSLIILCLIPLSLRLKIKKYELANIALILFFLWSIISFLFLPNINVVYGIISLGELILVYLLFRIYISKENIPSINILLISMLIFQLIIGGLQYIFQRPIGLVAESVITGNPFGLTTPEESTFFRITGTMVHPNNFAATLLALIPFLLFYKTNNIFLKSAKIMCLLVLFFTYSRAAWGVLLLVGIIYLILEKQQKILSKIYLLKIPTLVLGIILFFFLFPYITLRLLSIQQAIGNFGSWDVRTKLNEEAVSLINQYSITGVGLNRSVEAYVSSPVTDLVDILGNYKYYRIHNTFLEIATETGIPGVILFILFLIFVFGHYFKLTNKSNFQKAAFYGLLGLIGMSLFNPFFHSSQLRLFFLLSAIILV